MAILQLQEKGKIQMFYNRWWKNSGTCNHDDKNKDSTASSLDVRNVGGIFVVLFCGLALAIVVAVIEFLWNSRKNAATDRVTIDHQKVGYLHIQSVHILVLFQQQSIWSEMLEELRFAVRCHGSTKKPALRRHCSKCLEFEPRADPCGASSDAQNGIVLRDFEQQRSPLNHRGSHQHNSYRYTIEDPHNYSDYSDYSKPAHVRTK